MGVRCTCTQALGKHTMLTVLFLLHHHECGLLPLAPTATVIADCEDASNPLRPEHSSEGSVRLFLAQCGNPHGCSTHVRLLNSVTGRRLGLRVHPGSPSPK